MTKGIKKNYHEHHQEKKRFKLKRNKLLMFDARESFAKNNIQGAHIFEILVMILCFIFYFF